jgi:hexosaminidase
MEGGLSPSATVMYWRGGLEDVPGKVVSMGNDIIMSPTSHCYFDYEYSKISTIKAYEYEPVPKASSDEQLKNILGIQANFWSQIDRTEAGVDKQLFPRILSIAEVAWSPKDKKDNTSFRERVNRHLVRLENLEVNYFQDPVLNNVE